MAWTLVSGTKLTWVDWVSALEIFRVLLAPAQLHLTGLFVAVLPFIEVRAPTDTLFLLCGELGFVAISFRFLLLLALKGGFTIL